MTTENTRGDAQPSDEPTAAELELQDSLRSIRNVGENAGRGSEPDEDDEATSPHS
ncbi:hypothetical protein GCM10027413_10950 [Conyzicola nivalis]|uniref:Uncharacterized protein n=1 Tax=Conyzicola nivalis TaxID=1477021 RepID=A0A916WHK3_9MICO|nr:hypothetical protein [Conyzicola nivalis]GGB01941.1 hypothetical protein GCM10010979_15680 [Conyzicola nivalis]